jgi:hypothetical protein
MLVMACSATPPVTTPAPATPPDASTARTVSATTAPVAPTRSTSRERSGAWTFAYAPGSYTYILTTNATVAPVSDTMQKRPVPQLSQSATIAIAGTGDVQVLSPVAATSTACDASTALATRAQRLLPKIPAQLAAGNHWRDSTVTAGCSGTIPATSTVISNYTVIGDTALATGNALQIHRIDSISASGEGSEGQHRLLISATGTGTTDLFLDTGAGRFIGSRGVQNTLISVTTSGRLTRFLQHVAESVTAAGPG